MRLIKKIILHIGNIIVVSVLIFALIFVSANIVRPKIDQVLHGDMRDFVLSVLFIIPAFAILFGYQLVAHKIEKYFINSKKVMEHAKN